MNIEDDCYYILPYFWIPEETISLRVRRDHVPYDVWERQGFLQTTEGNVVHYGFIENFIDELGTRYNIKDPAGNIKMDKEKSTEKIDGSVATVMALDRAIRCGCETADSVYDSREMILL